MSGHVCTVRYCASVSRAFLGLATILAVSDASGQPSAPFTEEALARGVNYTSAQVQTHGQGALFADLDGDNDPDMVLLGDAAGKVGLFENDGTGTFVDRSLASGIGPVLDTSGIIAGDYDADGDLDLYVSRWNAPSRLFRNEGNLQFADVTVAAGVGNNARATGCAWGDYDLDGHLDLYVSNWDGPNRLYRNLGDGSFLDVGTTLGVDGENHPTFQAVLVDFDRDGDLDIYLATDRGVEFCVEIGHRNRLYRNDGGLFVDITDASGTEACVDAMCIAVGDFDANGFPDFYVTNTPPGNALLLNQGDGTFTEGAVAAGVAVFQTGWGSVFFDHDNDGFLDLYVCNALVPNRLFRHEGYWPCNDVAPAMNVANSGRSYVVSTADIDDDGDVDFLLQNRSEIIRLFVNHADSIRRWAKFRPYGAWPRRIAVGAVVDVRTGAIWQTRDVLAGCNYKSQNELTVHMGLDDALVMDEVVVTWPGGVTRTLTGLPTNMTWPIYPPERLGDVDDNGVRDMNDIDDFIESVIGAPVNIDRLARSDMNGDGRVDGRDVRAFVAVLLP